MTDREILDQLEQWLVEQRNNHWFNLDGNHGLEAALDKLRELRALAWFNERIKCDRLIVDDPDLTDWLTERAQSTSPSQPIDNLLDKLDDK
jgi:hypothetical protein